MKKSLTKTSLYDEAILFCRKMELQNHPFLLGVTDGKAVGTYIEHCFQDYLEQNYSFIRGNSASGIDLPGAELNTDIKTTSIQQPQSSCPYKNANSEDIVSYLMDRGLPGDDITLNALAAEILEVTPAQGYLTISNALQWRLQYSRVISLKNTVEGVKNYDRNS